MPRLPKFVFPLFLIIFLIVAPIMVMYTYGYRYDFKKRSFLRVGFMLIDGQPKTADVYLQGSHAGTGLPLYLKQLAPDYYSIELKNNGYHPLKTSREIKSHSSSVLSPIFLLKNTVPVLVTPLLSDNVWVNQDMTFSIAHTVTSTPSGTKNEFLVYDFANNVWQRLFTSELEKSFDVQFLQNNNEVLITSSNSFPRLVHLNNKTTEQITIPLTGATIDPKDKNVLYGIIGTSLVSYNMRTGATATIKSNAQLPVVVLDNWLGYVDMKSRFKPTLVLIPRVKPESSTPLFLESIPDGEWSHSINDGSLTAITNGTISYLFYEGEGIPKWSRIDGNRMAVTQKQEGKNVFIYNQFDIQKWSESDTTANVVGRYGGDLASAVPLFGTEYLIVAAGNSLIALSPTDTSLTPLTIAKNVKVTSMFSNKKGTSLYFVGTFEGKTGIFELPMRDE